MKTNSKKRSYDKKKADEEFYAKPVEEQMAILDGYYNLLGEIIKLSLSDMFAPILATEIDDSMSQGKVTRYIDAFTERQHSVLFFKNKALFELIDIDPAYLITQYLENLIMEDNLTHSYKQWLRYRLRAVQDGDVYEDLVSNNRNYKKAIRLYKKYKDGDMRGKYENNLIKKKSKAKSGM